MLFSKNFTGRFRPHKGLLDPWYCVALPSIWFTGAALIPPKIDRRHSTQRGWLVSPCLFRADLAG